MDKAELEALDLEGVKKVAGDLGVKFSLFHSKDRIIGNILAALDGEAAAPDEQPAEADPAESPAKVEEVEAVVTVAPEETAASIEPESAAAVEEMLKERATAVQNFKPDAPLPGKDRFPTAEEAKAALQSHVNRGLEIVEMSDTYFHLRVGRREAAGNMKMPLAQLVLQANILLRPTAQPTEE